MAKSAADLVAEARGRIQTLSIDETAAEIEDGDVLLVDIREPGERAEKGAITGSLHAVRGMLEFYADPDSPYHLSELRPDRRVILHCASGGRSALAAAMLQDLGYADVAHMDGGLTAWIEAGRAVDQG